MSTNTDGSPAPRYQVQITPEIRIPADDGTCTLAATLYRPITDEPVPALVTLVPYRRDAAAGIMYGPYLHDFAQAGFASLLVDFRGTGSSEGALRAAFDPAEADDGVAVIEWAARQPWCNGAVGMWGHSYGAITSMRVASRRPAALKAIIPVQGMIDPERDFVHPYGHRGALGSVASWGIETLASQLLPPLEDYGSVSQQARWLRRVHDTEPWLAGLLRDGPGAAAWRTRVIDVAAIEIPTFLIAGWRDLFCDGTFRAYEQISAPKRLLAGPWMHTMPDTAPSDRLDFRSLALEWWNRWLRGQDGSEADGPGLVVYLQHDPQPWRQIETWPPKGEIIHLAATPHATLADSTDRAPDDDTASGGDDPDRAIASADDDATIGALGGLWNLPSPGFGLPLDQHDDDLRGLHWTSEPVTADLPIIGRPRVAATLAAAAHRLVVRLTSVDRQGRSTLICAGTAPARGAGSGTTTVTLDPTAYLLRSGHRLRVAVSSADFPRLWPAPAAGERLLALRALHLVLPVAAGPGEPAVLPATDALPPAGPGGIAATPRWTITRDPITGSTEVCFGAAVRAVTQAGVDFRSERDMAARVGPGTPTVVHGTAQASAVLPVGETVDVYVTLHLTDTYATATAEIMTNGRRVAERSWQIPVPAETPAQSEGAHIP
jgi:uncharacterized protein